MRAIGAGQRMIIEVNTHVAGLCALARQRCGQQQRLIGLRIKLCQQGREMNIDVLQPARSVERIEDRGLVSECIHSPLTR